VKLHDRVAIVTGAARGIGAASARRFAAEGAKVALADLDLEGAREVARQIGGDCMAIRCDHTRVEDDQALVAAVLDRWGCLDILFNNAAGTGKASFQDCPEEDFLSLLDSSLMGPWRLAKAALGPLRASAQRRPETGAVVLFTGSRVSGIGAAGNSPYIVSKHAILGLVRSMAADLGPHNIRVNAVCPGIVPTPRVMVPTAWGSPQAVLEKFLARTPLARITQPEDIAATAAFLVSDDARAITGQALYVDGGMSAV
jgi:NAD(P)-dependent dehydrogenase (short-subunit alcohol dehydrogenase family)